MIIRSEQMTSLEKAADAGFVDMAVRHMQSFRPAKIHAAGERQAGKAARSALEAAQQYGFEAIGSKLFYLDLTVLFGHRFPSDPFYAWLHPHLGPMEGLDGFGRSRLLYWHVTAYLDRAYGPDNQLREAALHRMHDLTIGRLERAARSHGDELIRWLHPRRRPFVDDAAISSAWENAAPAGGGAGAALHVALTFLFGSGVWDDPLHQWAAEAGLPVEARLQRAQSYIEMLQPEAVGAAV